MNSTYFIKTLLKVQYEKNVNHLNTLNTIAAFKKTFYSFSVIFTCSMFCFSMISASSLFIIFLPKGSISKIMLATTAETPIQQKELRQDPVKSRNSPTKLNSQNVIWVKSSCDIVGCSYISIQIWNLTLHFVYSNITPNFPKQFGKSYSGGCFPLFSQQLLCHVYRSQDQSIPIIVTKHLLKLSILTY